MDFFLHGQADIERKARAAEMQQALRAQAAVKCIPLPHGSGAQPNSHVLVNISATASENSSVAWPMDVESVR